MPLHVNDVFTRDITIGFLVSLIGAMLIVLVGVGWQYFGGWAPRGHSPFTLPAFCAVGVGLFSVGLLWQLVGYLRLEYTRWWTW